MVSRKTSAAPRMRLETVELEVRGQSAAKLSQRGQQFTAAGALSYLECARSRDLDLDLVSRLETERLDDRCRKAHAEAVAPFRDLHGRPPPWIYICPFYIHALRGRKAKSRA